METPQKKVLVPIAFGSEEIEVVTLVNVFSKGGALVTVASVEQDLLIECSSRVKLVADTFISECESQIFDLVVLPGGMPGSERLRDCEDLRKITEAHAKEGRLCGAVGEAPSVVLETWGLLKACQATCHPSFMDQLSSAVAVDSSIQVDGMVTTSQGPALTLDFALSIAERLFGKKMLDEVLLRSMVPRGWNKCEVAKEEYNVDDWSLQNIPQVLVPIANGSDEMEIVVVVDVLRRAKVNVLVASIEDSLEIVAARGTKIVADQLIKEAILSNYDLIHLPGGWYGAQKLGSSEQLVALLREHAESKVYGAICASAVMLDTKGLLKGKKATTHPHYSSKLSDQSSVNVRVVIDGKVITSIGPGSAMEYAVIIVEKLLGMDKANHIAETMGFSYP